MAIEHAHRVLDWRENVMSAEEMPPEWMWPFYDEIEQWFDEVKRARDEKYGMKSDDDDDDSGERTGPMIANEYAAGRR